MNKPAPSLVSEGAAHCTALLAVALPACPPDCLPAFLAKLTMTISRR